MTSITGIATSFIDFTRASNATVTDSDGLVKWAPHNLLLNSESFDAASWAKSSVTPTANSIAAPNGTTTADTLAASGANGTTLQTFTAEAISYTFAVWLKRKTGTGNIQIAADSGTYTTVTITSDWALYTVTQTPTAGSKTAGIRIVTSADEVYAWGASLYRSDLAMQPNTSAYPMYNPTTPKNLLGYTESLTTGWTNSNTTDAIVSEVNPVGLTGAVNVAATAGNGTLLSSLSLLASPYTFSIWLKRNTGSGTVEITVDGTTYVAAAVTGTWTRFSTTLTPTAGTKTPGIRLVTSGDAVYAWGAQLSDSASLDTYSPVYGAAVTSAAYYGPRRDFDPVTLACKGLLVEEQRTNLLLYSAQFDNGYWTPDNVTVDADEAVSPDGTMTADLIYPTSSGAGRSIARTTVSLTNGLTYSTTIRIKAAGIGFAYVYNVQGNSLLYVNLTTGLTSNVGTNINNVVSSIANGWVTLSFSSTLNTGSAGSLYIGPCDAAGSTTVTASGINGIYLWGAQLEDNAAFATSYIPTGAATATRNADVASVSTQAFPYSASESTIVASASPIGPGGSAGSAVFSLKGASGNGLLLYQPATTYSLVAYVDASNVTLGTSSFGAIEKLAIAYNGVSNGAVRNGGTVSSVGTTVATAADSFYFGNIAAAYVFNGHIRQITYLPRRISNTELQTRTS